MKIIVAGVGKVGESLVSQLRCEGYDLTIIDNDTGVLENGIERYDVMTVQGNCAAVDTLKRAGIEEANLLICAANSDEINLLSCLTAHALNPKIHTIARIRDPEYADQAYLMREALGLSLTFNPEKQTAKEIERLIRFPGFLMRETFARGQVEIVELKIEQGSKLDGVKICDLNGVVNAKVLVCTVLRNGEALMPKGDFELLAEDRLFVTGTTVNLSHMLKNLNVVTKRAKRVILAGGGNVSYYLASMLIADRMDVVIIERDKERCRYLAELLPEATVVWGDVSDHEVIERERISDTDAVVSLTGLDELNIIVSLYANSCNALQTITKLGREDNGKILDTLPIGSVVSPKRICANKIVKYVRAMRNQTGAAVSLHLIADGQAEALEFKVDSDFENCDKALRDLHIKKNVLIACIIRGKSIIIPNGDSAISVGDNVVVVSNREAAILTLNDIFE